MFPPALQLARDDQRGGSDFPKLLGRAYADPSPFVRNLLAERYAAQDARFVQAFAKALPDLAPQDLTMRLHFVLRRGSPSTLASEDARKLMTTFRQYQQRRAGGRRRRAGAPRTLPRRLASCPSVNQNAQVRAIRAVLAFA